MEIEVLDITGFYFISYFVDSVMSDAVRSDADGSAPTILTSVSLFSSVRIANRNLQLEIIWDVTTWLQTY